MATQENRTALPEALPPRPLPVHQGHGLVRSRIPGRIDLGIGRALGSDPVVTSYLRMTGTTNDVDAFPRNVADIRSLMHPEGAAFRLQSGQMYELTATPNAASVAELWLLGSSDYSPRLAAAQGMPYVFAHHFSGEEIERILGLCRDNFVRSDQFKDPRTFLTLNVSVAATAEEASPPRCLSCNKWLACAAECPLALSPPWSWLLPPK